jgi:hypothetical protein
MILLIAVTHEELALPMGKGVNVRANRVQLVELVDC